MISKAHLLKSETVFVSRAVLKKDVSFNHSQKAEPSHVDNDQTVPICVRPDCHRYIGKIEQICANHILSIICVHIEDLLRIALLLNFRVTNMRFV